MKLIIQTGKLIQAELMHVKRIVIFAILFVAGQGHAQNTGFATPQKGFVSKQPAAGWEHALLSGNGQMGALVMGQPQDETIILSHALLYLPRKRSPKMIDQASRLHEIRQLLLEGKYQEAAQIPADLRRQQNYFDERDPFIPAFDIRITQDSARVQQYQRSVNFETGEAVVDWKAEGGSFQRRVFVSRADNVVVVWIKGSEKINCKIAFAQRPVLPDQKKLVEAHLQNFHAQAGGGWLHYQTEFKYKNHKAIHAFEGLGRVEALNGRVETDSGWLRISGADEVLLLVRIQPLYSSVFRTAYLKQQLNRIEKNYEQLLARHSKLHSALFNRVQFRLNANGEDRRLPSEELLEKAKSDVPLALVEKTFDAGRYNIISATGINPPNLQGIWTGTWTSPWAGSMTNDGNLPTAVSIYLPANMPGLLLPYFNYHEGLLDDYRTSAKALYNCRGIHVPAQATTTGLDTDFGETWCLTFWTGGAGWVSNYFWDYYQYTLDKEFLRRRAYPFMKEALLFYEDFLHTGADGKYIFNPSYSPENHPSNTNSQAVVNATMDVMIAKQLLRHCIEAAGILKMDTEKIEVWRSMLSRMPGYELNKDGALREWLWKNLQDNYGHRHASHLYALFDEVAPEFKSGPELRQGVQQLIAEKMEFREKENGGEMAFGLVQLGSAAAHLGDAATSWTLVQWLASRYWSTGMGSFHNVHHLFNTDISGGLPYLITQMLAYAERGLVSILPALPPEWKKGSIGGLLLRGNIILEQLEWDEKSIRLRLHTPAQQKLRMVLPGAYRFDKPAGARITKDPSSNVFHLKIPAGKTIELIFTKLVDEK